MKDKLDKKRIVIDYIALIKSEGLWRVYRAFKKRYKHINSENRIMYFFCQCFLYEKLQAYKKFREDCAFAYSSEFKELGWKDFDGED